MKTTTDDYLIHDLPLSVHCQHAATLEAIRRRFMPYAFQRRRARHLSDPVKVVISVDECLRRPAGPGRRVYDSPVADVSYHEETESLVVDAGDLVEMVADTRTGLVRMSVLEDCDEAWSMCAHPLMTLCLLELMKRRGCYPLHAGGVVLDDAAILMPGASGAGKSTLTCALLQAGLGFLSDDIVFLHPHDQGTDVLSFADELDVTDGTAEMFPELADLVGAPLPPGRPKHQVRAEHRFGSRLVDRASARAIVFPAIVAEGRSTLRKESADDLLATLAPNVLLTDPVTSQRHFEALADLADSVPVYRLDFGRDVAAAAQTILAELS